MGHVVLAILKSELLTLHPLIVSLVPVPFVSVTVCEAEVRPTFTFPKSSVDGSSVTGPLGVAVAVGVAVAAVAVAVGLGVGVADGDGGVGVAVDVGPVANHRHITPSFPAPPRRSQLQGSGDGRAIANFALGNAFSAHGGLSPSLQKE
jgi:hypothetical protein